MTDQTPESFEKEVTKQALKMYFATSLVNGKLAIQKEIKEIHSTHMGMEKDEQKKAIVQAEKLLSNETIKHKLCLGLRSINNDIKDVSKIVTAVLFHLSLNPASNIPMNTLIFAAIVVSIVRTGINVLCPGKED